MPETPPDYKTVEVQLQRFVPQLATVIVAVPDSWSNKVIESRLSDIYEAIRVEDVEVDWHDQVDFEWSEAKEGTHELTGVSSTRPELIYPPEEDDDGDDE